MTSVFCKARKNFIAFIELFCFVFRTFVPSMPDELNFFISGGLAGMLGWTVAMPLDVPKTNVSVFIVEFLYGFV